MFGAGRSLICLNYGYPRQNSVPNELRSRHLLSPLQLSRGLLQVQPGSTDPEQTCHILGCRIRCLYLSINTVLSYAVWGGPVELGDFAQHLLVSAHVSWVRLFRD